MLGALLAIPTAATIGVLIDEGTEVAPGDVRRRRGAGERPRIGSSAGAGARLT